MNSIIEAQQEFEHWRTVTRIAQLRSIKKAPKRSVKLLARALEFSKNRPQK